MTIMMNVTQKLENHSPLHGVHIMFKQIITLSIVGAGLLFTGSATAHSAHGHHGHNNDYQVIAPILHPAPRPVRHCVTGHRINKMQANQQHRIQKGKRQGKLVRWEMKQLRNQQRKIKQAEQRMRNSHHCLTKQESKKLVKRLQRANRKIQQLTRNGARNRHGRNNRNGRGHRHTHR